VIVLDTHVWVWWVSQTPLLSMRVKRLIDRCTPSDPAYLSSISVWEVAMLVAKGRLQLTMDTADWIAKCEALPNLRFVPIDNRILLRATSLPEPFHKDPADRFIVSTALQLGARLFTKDDKLRAYPHVETVW